MSAQSLLASPRPTVGVDLGAGRVTVVRLAAPAVSAAVAGFAVEALPPGALTPALNAPNIANRPAVVEALQRAMERAGARPGHAALVVPDTVAKVSLLRFERVPSRASDFLELVRWQVRKSVPFAVETAQIGWMPGTPADGAPGHEFVVTIARRDVVREYEGVLEAAGLLPGVVDLSSFNLINAVLASGARPAGDWLVVHAAADYLTLVVLRGDDVIFFRHRGADDDTSLADVVHQTAMYYEDRLRGAGFERVVLAGAGRHAVEDGRGAPVDPGIEVIRRELEQRLRVGVDLIDPRPAVTLTDRISASPALLDTLAAAAGVLVRDGEA